MEKKVVYFFLSFCQVIQNYTDLCLAWKTLISQCCNLKLYSFLNLIHHLSLLEPKLQIQLYLNIYRRKKIITEKWYVFVYWALLRLLKYYVTAFNVDLMCNNLNKGVIFQDFKILSEKQLNSNMDWLCNMFVLNSF